MTNQVANSIVINANATGPNPVNSGFYVNPIRSDTSVSSNALVYNSYTNEIVYNTSKTFVIQHPIEDKRYLVHTCVEGPDSELLYRGCSQIINNEFVEISIPDYAQIIGFDWNIQLTPIGEIENPLSCSEIDNSGCFVVYSNDNGNCKFYWYVYGKRTLFDVEPFKNDVDVHGDGPYKWI